MPSPSACWQLVPGVLSMPPSPPQLHSEVEKPLMNFRENFKKDMKKCDHHIADLRKQLASRYAAVEKVRGPGCWAGGRGPPGRGWAEWGR